MALPSRITTMDNISALLNQSEEWKSAWASSLLLVVQNYDVSLTQKSKPHARDEIEGLDESDGEPVVKRAKQT